MKITTVEPVSCGKMLGGVYAFLALIFGAFIALLSLMGVSLGGNRQGGILALVMGVGAIVIFPITYFVFGFIGGILSALFYNIVAKVFGGIEINVE